MCGVFRIRSTTARSVRCTALEKTSERTIFAAHNRLYLGPAENIYKLTPSLVILLHPAEIHLVGIAGKMQDTKLFFETYKLTTYMYLHVYLLYALQANSRGSMFDRGKVCLDCRHKRVWAESPPNNFIRFVSI